MIKRIGRWAIITPCNVERSETSGLMLAELFDRALTAYRDDKGYNHPSTGTALPLRSGLNNQAHLAHQGSDSYPALQ